MDLLRGLDGAGKRGVVGYLSEAGKKGYGAGDERVESYVCP